MRIARYLDPRESPPTPLGKGGEESESPPCQGGFSGAMPTARSANEREVSSRLCATRQGDSD
jgi:hypothetical protein